jgi:hypothetical protein
MTGYIVLPPQIVDDERSLRTWLDRAVAFGQSLPPKAGRKK